MMLLCVTKSLHNVFTNEMTHTREFFINAVCTSRKPQMKTSTGRTGRKFQDFHKSGLLHLMSRKATHSNMHVSI